MLHFEVECPFCQKSLMDDEHHIKEHPSIEFLGTLPAEAGGGEDLIRLSAYYGDYQVETSLVIPPGVVVEFRCPFCKSLLTSTRLCELCTAPMVAAAFPRGGRIQFCSRRGCKKHLIEFDDLEEELRAFYEDNSLS